LDPQKWNSIVNKAALSSRTNRILGGHKPSTYIQTIQRQHGVDPSRLDDIFESHLIDLSILRADDFPGFILKRAGLLLDLIQIAMGKTIVGRDSGETLVAFGGSLTEISPIEIEQEAIGNQNTQTSSVFSHSKEILLKKDLGKIKRQWDEESFFNDLELRRGPEEANIAKRILEWAKDRFPRFWWGNGDKDGSVYPILDYNGRTYYPIGIWSYGKLEIQFQYLKRNSPFDLEAKRIEFLDRLNQIPGFSIPEDAISRRPNIYLAVLKDEKALKQFLEALDWVFHEIRET